MGIGLICYRSVSVYLADHVDEELVDLVLGGVPVLFLLLLVVRLVDLSLGDPLVTQITREAAAGSL